MDPVLADKILEVLVKCYNAIGSKELADKIDTEEEVVVSTIYEIKKMEVGLFSVTSGIGKNMKELQPLVPAIRDRLDSGGFTKLFNESSGKIQKSDPSKLHPDLKTENNQFRKRMIIVILVIILVAAMTMIAKQYTNI